MMLSPVERETVDSLLSMGFDETQSIQAYKGSNLQDALDAILSDDLGGPETSTSTLPTSSTPKNPFAQNQDDESTLSSSTQHLSSAPPNYHHHHPPPPPNNSIYGPKDYQEIQSDVVGSRDGWKDSAPGSTAVVPYEQSMNKIQFEPSKWLPDVDLTLDEDPIDNDWDPKTTTMTPNARFNSVFDPNQLADAIERSTQQGKLLKGSDDELFKMNRTKTTTTTDEDSEFQRAIAMSMIELGQGRGNSTTMDEGSTLIEPKEAKEGTTMGLGGDDDDALEKAMALSLGDLRNTSGPGGGDSLQSHIKPEERIKKDGDGPVILRSTSALLGILSSFLQCLFAVSTWRKTILEFRPNQFDLGCGKSLQGMWNGTDQSPSLEGPGRESKDRVWAIIAIQRLFALMQGTKRSFLHITEVTHTLDPNLELLDPRTDYVTGIHSVIEMLIETLRDYAVLNVGDLPVEERFKIVQKEAQKFCIAGKAVNNNSISLAEVIEDDFPAVGGGDVVGILRLRIPSFSFLPPASLYRHIDAQLNETIDTLKPISKPTAFNFITHFSKSLILRLDRYDHALTSLEHFGATEEIDRLGEEEEEEEAGGSTTMKGSGSGSLLQQNTKKGLAAKNGGGMNKKSRKSIQLEETLWLDRYDASRKVEIVKQRNLLWDLENQLIDLQARRKRLARTKEGREALVVVREVKEYLTKSVEAVDSVSMEGGVQVESEDESGRRRNRLKEVYEKVQVELRKKIEECDEVIRELEARIESVFEGDEWKRRGPYRLKAILMRNGLNGRGSAWSVVKEGDKWWRIRDLEKTEVTFEEAATDPSGLMMNAGATLLFYENPNFEPAGPGGRDDASSSTESSNQISSLLQHLVLEDNHRFAAELPREIVDSWVPALDPLPSTPPSLDEEERWIDRRSPVLNVAARGMGMDYAPPSPPFSDLGNAGAVEEFIEFLPAVAADQDVASSPVAINLSIDEFEDAPPYTDTVMEGASSQFGTETPKARPLPAIVPSSIDSPMNVDEDSETLRLRGGVADDVEIEADDSEGEETYSEDDDEFDDDDEVELGLLQLMSKREKDWNIDFDIGKVGGKPVWLDPRSPLSPSQVTCGVCQTTMALLIQVNSPDDTRPHAAARSLYIYACKSEKCLTKPSDRTMKVWRIQMPSPNNFYPHTPETQKKREELESELDPTSRLASASSSTTPTPWPEWDIVCKPEPYEESYLDSDGRQATEGAPEDAELPDTQTGVDKAFLAFQERVERVPEQVVRFYRLPDVIDPQPLWASQKRVTADEVPKCSLCGAARQVEFQILSTLLSFLKDDHLSFDSLLIYTCAENCAIPISTNPAGSGWAEEILILQEFDQQGVRFGRA